MAASIFRHHFYGATAARDPVLAAIWRIRKNRAAASDKMLQILTARGPCAAKVLALAARDHLERADADERKLAKKLGATLVACGWPPFAPSNEDESNNDGAPVAA